MLDRQTTEDHLVGMCACGAWLAHSDVAPVSHRQPSWTNAEVHHTPTTAVTLAKAAVVLIIAVAVPSPQQPETRQPESEVTVRHPTSVGFELQQHTAVQLVRLL